MEKHIARFDATDMMLFGGMYEHARKLQFKQYFARTRKVITHIYAGFEQTLRTVRTLPRVWSLAPADSDSMVTAVYSIAVATVLISFFWLSLFLG